MVKNVKIAEIRGYWSTDFDEALKTLINGGFEVLDDDIEDTNYKIYHIFKKYETQ